MGRGQDLLDAARQDDRKTVEKIIAQLTKRSGPFPSMRRGPGVNVKDDNGYTPLHHASLNGHKDIVQLLLTAEASPCHVDKSGATPLHLAAFNGHSEVVAMLLAHNSPPVNINQLTQTHDTALLMAAEFGHTRVVSILLSHGADATTKNANDMNALDLAVQFDRKDVVKLLLRMRPQLIDQYRHPPEGRIFKHTPLHRACMHGREEVVKELLAAEVDPNLRTEGGTPLHEAVNFARESIVHLLLMAGANLRARNSDGRTVLNMLAAYPDKGDRFKAVRLVIQKFQSQCASRCSYDSEEELPPFPVLDSPPAKMPITPYPGTEAEDSISGVTNANMSNSKPTSPLLSSKHASTDSFTDLNRNRTDSFLERLKMIQKLAIIDNASTKSDTIINKDKLISQIKAINSALQSKTVQTQVPQCNDKFMSSAVYENLVYKLWPELDREPQVNHGKVENIYANTEEASKLYEFNDCQEKVQPEWHQEQYNLHGAKVSQVNDIIISTNINDFSIRSPVLNRDKIIQCNSKNNEIASEKQANGSPTFRKINKSPLKKVTSQSDLFKYNQVNNLRRETMDPEFEKVNINKSSTFSKYTPRPQLDLNNPYRRETIDSAYKHKYRKEPLKLTTPNQKSVSPRPERSQPFRRETLEKQSLGPNNDNDCNTNSLKKRPRPLPKPKLSPKISDAIEKLSARQAEKEAQENIDYNELIDSEQIYENLPRNISDDMKATGIVESEYVTMNPISQSYRKRFASDYIPSAILRVENKINHRTVTDRISLSYDYVNFDDMRGFDFGEKGKKLTRKLSVPEFYKFGEKSTNMHMRGVAGCLHEEYDYLYFYELNPRALHENVHPFNRKKEKAIRMPCYCRDLSKFNSDIDASQYLSCEDMADKEDAVYCSVDEVYHLNQSNNHDDAPFEFLPFDSSADASVSDDQEEGARLQRNLTIIVKKKVSQMKQFLTDWKAPETQEISNKNESFLSPSSSSLTKIHPQSFVKKLASKCLGLKAKFNSAPNISNSTETEVDVVSKKNEQKNSSTLLIGNSKFFKILTKKDESGEIVCNDEFDTISLDRLGTLNRDSVVNRSNRSCPGFKTSLPNISENNELSDQESTTESFVMCEVDCDSHPVTETVNTNLNIFEPRNRFSVISNKSSGSATVINECYESYEFNDLELRISSNTLPRPDVTKNIKTENLIYENVVSMKSKPTPAARTHIPVKLPLDEVEKKILYENVTILRDKKPEPPKRTLFPNQIRYDSFDKDSSRSASRTSTMSSDSMVDESNLEDILLSAKSKSFRHGKIPPLYSGTCKSNASRTKSNASYSSEGSDVSAIENIDCSEDIDNSANDVKEKSMYLSMTGTLPIKKSEGKGTKKVLFRHKTFTNMEVDRNSFKVRDLPQWNNEFLKETLAHYHIRGTGHCIYKAPTVKEFIYIFNRDTLYKDVPPFTKVPNDKRDSYFETAICFCRPKPPKHHNSAEDLLASGVPQEDETVIIDVDALKDRREIFLTSFQCFCESGSCKFNSNRRETLRDLVVKFSAIKRSISTPDITLDHSLNSTRRQLPKNMSVPQNLEEPYYAVVDLNIVERNKSIRSAIEQGYVPMSRLSSLLSHPSTLQSNSSARPYSIKDIAEVISLNRSTSTASTQSNDRLPVCKSSSSENSGHWSLQSCNSDVTIRSDLSFKSCEESSDDGSDGTLHSDDDSEAETIKSAKRPWVHSDSFRFGGNCNSKPEIETIVEETNSSFEDKLESLSSKFESGISVEGSSSSSSGGEDDSGVPRGVVGASLERGNGGVRSGSGRRRWDDLEGTSEGDALSISSAASSCAPLHLMQHYEHSKVSPTPPKKPPRRNLSVSPTHANSPSSGYSYELRIHARSQDDLDDIQGAKHYLKHGRSVDHYESKLSYSEYEENHNSPRVVPIPNPRPSLKQRSQPVAITAMYENVVIKEQNPRRKLRRNVQPGETYEPRTIERVRKYSNQERSSLESLLDDQSMNSPSDCERYYDGPRIEVPLSPSHYEQPPTPDHPPPSAKQAENSIHERIRPLSQEYKRRSALRDSYTETEVSLLRAASAASVASGATDRSGNTDNCVEEYVCDVPFAGLFKGSTTTLDGIGLRPMPAERPKTLRKLKSVYDSSPTDPPLNGANINEEEVRRRSNTTSSNHSADKSLSILSPFDEQEEWAKISEIMASFGSKLVRESVFVSELEQEFTTRLGLSCSESSLSPSVASNLGLWLAGIGLHDYESLFLEGGYDDIDFVNGVLDETDLREMGIEENDRQKILESSKQLPLKIAEISNNHNNNNISNKNQNESVDEWLRQINLEQYSDTFRKHLYVDMDRVRRIWEVELTAVLEINKAGHRKRILASVSGEQNGPINNHMEDINTDLNTLKNNIQQLKEEIKEKLPISENLKPVPPPVVPTLIPPGGETLKRSKKNRPAPQPPRPSDLEIRAPSELLVGVPGALKTQWKHQPFVLVTGAVTYVANYLGSTVVKELRGTESTKKSIQKLKKTTKEPRDSPDIILSISYRGVKFLNTITRELVCEHEIRNIHCACQDADDLTHFAYITKDHTTRSHYCHVFRVATMDQATEVILTLGEAFEVAYQMALREQSNRTRITQSLAKTPTHDPLTTSNKDKPSVNHGRSHSITEIKLNGHQLKIAPLPASLSNEDFQRATDGSRSPRTPLLKAPIASTEEL